MSKTFADEIEEEAGTSQILAIVIGPCFANGIPGISTSKLLTWEEARPMLDYGIDNQTFGRNPFYAWTYNRVLFLSQHDGQWVSSVPRTPSITPIPEAL